jgi:hypothetical protein
MGGPLEEDGHKETEVYILALGGGLLKERMGFAKMLRVMGGPLEEDGRCMRLCCFSVRIAWKSRDSPVHIQQISHPTPLASC